METGMRFELRKINNGWLVAVFDEVSGASECSAFPTLETALKYVEGRGSAA